MGQLTWGILLLLAGAFLLYLGWKGGGFKGGLFSWL